jgi:hypothetical protein
LITYGRWECKAKVTYPSGFFGDFWFMEKIDGLNGKTGAGPSLIDAVIHA